MKLLCPTISLGLFGIAVQCAAVTNTKSQEGTLDIIRGLKQDPEGFTDIGADGIARSLDGQGNVIDFRRLTNAQLLKLAQTTSVDAEELEHNIAAWQDADGWKVPLTQALNPPNKAEDINNHGSMAKSIDTRPAAMAAMQLRADIWCYAITCTTNIECRRIHCTGCSTRPYQRRYCYP
ncbi:predicted protein [Histoplasma capsulatum G186AR]|uniref:Uncharacterized protein n=1 Tax=Ajellomyces capsulatus (strain G186AR / H82 / ATCC MYA-2454 / RMSCC 2432) TaxID=447093 RepID=C0NZZ3_AJECG|nr:uncharacterized protein HCBG_08723 [Histoplasma capsulatum G186AR]EEH03083.1 predicted protein [Histoplasma capsulatum G186AR]